MWRTLSRFFTYVTELAAMLVLMVSVMKVPFGDLVREYTVVLSDSDPGAWSRNLVYVIWHLVESALWLIVGSMSFVVCVVNAILYYGLKENQPALIRVYLVFGFNFTMFFVVVAVLTMVKSDTETGGYILLGCVIYAVCLLVIYKAYEQTKKLSALTTLLTATQSDQ